MQGLVETDGGGGAYHALDTGGSSGGLESSVEVSHLDSFFANSGWTREDLMLVLGTINVAAWLALLYLEVNRR